MNNLIKNKTQKGFTLIELLVVVTIIAVLAVGVFAALNPAQRLKDARNAKRTQDVDTILTAIHEFEVDSKGATLTNMPAAGTTSQLGTAVAGCATHGATACGSTAACADLLSGANALTKYIKSVPVDPSAADANETGYSVVVDTNGIFTVTACLAEGTTVSASR